MDGNEPCGCCLTNGPQEFDSLELGSFKRLVIVPAGQQEQISEAFDQCLNVDPESWLLGIIQTISKTFDLQTVVTVYG